MNNIVTKLNDVSIINTNKTHDLLDRVLEAEAINFPTNEIRFDNEHVAFVTNVDDYTLVVMRDLNMFAVIARVTRKNGVNAAECVITIDGQFNETYSRIHNKDVKHKISDWFSAIGSIDLTTLNTGCDIESEKNIPDDNDEK